MKLVIAGGMLMISAALLQWWSRESCALVGSEDRMENNNVVAALFR